ncbi:hypothetical protein, partial [Kordiimonas gwangyangensis]|uniref:hypothetical protein n=1 Tax=Kordiimonas gwangyangensis TaxID=288022 RepID=UPI00058ECC6E
DVATNDVAANHISTDDVATNDFAANYISADDVATNDFAADHTCAYSAANYAGAAAAIDAVDTGPRSGRMALCGRSRHL